MTLYSVEVYIMRVQEIRSQPKDHLEQLCVTLKHEIVLSVALESKNSQQRRSLRRDLARVSTIIKQK